MPAPFDKWSDQQKSKIFWTPTHFLPNLLTPKYKITAFALSMIHGKKCTYREIVIMLSGFFHVSRTAKKVSNILQPIQSLLHKAEGILGFFYCLASFALWKGPRCKVAHFGFLCSFPETCSPSVTVFFIKCMSWMSNPHLQLKLKTQVKKCLQGGKVRRHFKRKKKLEPWLTEWKLFSI